MSRNASNRLKFSSDEDPTDGDPASDNHALGLDGQLQSMYDRVEIKKKTSAEVSAQGDYDLGQVLQQTALETGPHLQFHQEAQGSYPLIWNREKGKNLTGIFFQDDPFITDAVIESWYHNLQNELCEGRCTRIMLKRCVNVTDWGIYWLAKLLSARYGEQEVILDGCTQFTERGVLDLCASGITLMLACNNTRVTSLPDFVVKQNPQHRFNINGCPLLATSMWGVDSDEKIFGPYNKVYIHQNGLSSGNLLDSFHDRKGQKGQKGISMVTDWSAFPPQNDDVPDLLKNKGVKLNIIATSEDDPSYGLAAGEEADQVVIPFDLREDVEKVASMAARAISLNASKERHRLSSGLQTPRNLKLPTPLWSIQEMYGCTFDFKTGILDVLPDIVDRSVRFAEEFSAYQHTLELKVLECTAVDNEPAIKFKQTSKREDSPPSSVDPTRSAKVKQFRRPVDIQALTSKSYTWEMKVKAGDVITAENSNAVMIKLNGKYVNSMEQGTPGLIFHNAEGLQLKLQVMNFNVNTKNEVPQHFVSRNPKNKATIFDPSSRTVRYVLGEKRPTRVLTFRGVQPITKSINTVTIRLVNLGTSKTISLGLAGSSYPAVDYQPGWKDNSIAVHMDDLRVFNGDGSSKDKVDREIIPATGDLIQMVVEDMPHDIIMPNDTVTLTYFHNGEQFVKRQWTCTGSNEEVVVPIIGLHSASECVELVDFAAPVPLHHRIMEQIGNEKPFITCGKATCEINNVQISSTDTCTQSKPQYFMAGNSVSKQNPIFSIKSNSTNEKAVFTIGLVQGHFCLDETPGKKKGTVIFSSRTSSVASLGTTSHVVNVNNFILRRGDRLGLGFKTLKDTRYDEYGVPCADQELTAVFYINGEEVAEMKFSYLGGGLFPIVSMGSTNLNFTLIGLLGKESFISDEYTAIELPVEPGTQYILTALQQGAQETMPQWREQAEAISEKVKKECEKNMQILADEKDSLWKKSLVTLNDHKHLSCLSQHLQNLSKIVENWKKRTHITLTDPHTKQGIRGLGEVLARNVVYSVQHHEYLYSYTDDTYKALNKICEFKSERIVTLAKIKEQFPTLSRPWLVEGYLNRLQRWGKVLLFLDQDPELVVTDPEWFFSVLSLLPDQPASKAGIMLPIIEAGSPVRKPRELLQASKEKLDREKLLQLLYLLVESHQLLRLKPQRNDKTDPKYFLLRPTDLGEVPSHSALKKYLAPDKHAEGYLDMSHVYRFERGQLLPYVWYAILARLTEICEPKMLWSEGIVWHQGPAECVLIVQNSDAGCGLSHIELSVRSFTCSTKRAQVVSSVQTLLGELFTVYTDLIDATLQQHGVFGEQSGQKQQINEEVSMYCEHNWIQPFQSAGSTVCTLCNNCCNSGLRCDYNGIPDDKPLTCLCETQKICCLDCGICQTCARKLWKYQAILRPGNLKEVTEKYPLPMCLSKCVVDGSTLNEFEFMSGSSERTKIQTIGLVSEDEELYILWSLDKKLKCPESVYRLPLLYNYRDFFEPYLAQNNDEEHTFRIKVSDPEMPLVENHGISRDTQKYNFSHMKMMRFFQETGIAECEVDSWDSALTSGYMTAQHPLTSKCFYFETEVLMTSSEGHVEIGLAETDHYGKARYGFKLSPTECIVGDLEMKQKYVHHSAVEGRERLGVGILFTEDDFRQTIFFVKNGEKQNVSLTNSHGVYPIVGISGKDWRVRLTTQGAWRAKIHQIHEAMDMQMDKAKKAQAWASFHSIEISPASVLQFSALGDPEVKETIKAELFLKVKPEEPYPILFKVKVTNLSRYVVRPNKGMVKPGETTVVSFMGRCSEFEPLVGDKFRIEWLEQKLGSLENSEDGKVDDVEIGHEAETWTIGWTENLAKVKNPHDTTLTAKSVKATEENLETRVDQFVKNIYLRKTQATVVPQELPKVTEGYLHKPHYKLEVYRDGKICSQSWLPRKKYYLATLWPQLTGLPIGAMQLEGFNIPRLPRRNLPTAFKPGMKVYAKFTEDLFAGAVSSETFNTSLKKTSDSDTDSQVPETKKKAVKFSSGESPEKKKSPLSGTPKNKSGTDISTIYGPCKVIQVNQEKIILEWKLGSLCLLDKPDHQWRVFEAKVEDIHSELWAEKMNFFTDVPVEQTFFDTSKTVAVWKAVTVYKPGVYKWDQKHKSPLLKLVNGGDTYVREATANRTDGARGEIGFTSGVHVFRFDNTTKLYGSYHMIGVCTAKANMQITKYGLLFGADEHSWAWNIKDNGLYHNNINTGTAPRNAAQEFVIDMKLNLKDPNWPYIQYSFPGQESSGFVAFQDTKMSEALLAGEKLYPCCGGVYGKHSVKISLNYSSLLTDNDADSRKSIGIYHPKKLETQFQDVPLPYLFPSERLAKFDSDDMIKVIMQKIDSRPFRPSRCCLKSASQTVRQRELYKLCSGFSENTSILLPNLVWIPLPREMDAQTLKYPALKDLTDISKLSLHFLCKARGDDLLQVISERFRMHFVDVSPSMHDGRLTEDLCFGVPAIACTYIAFLKVLLPVYEHLFPQSVEIPRKSLEHCIQGILRLLSSVMMANFPPTSVRGYNTDTDGWQAMWDMPDKIQKLESCIDGVIWNKVDPKGDWMCKSHQTSLGTLSDISTYVKRLNEDGDERNVLDLSLYEPYNELLSKFQLTAQDSGLEVIPDEFQTYFPNLVSLEMDQPDDLKKLPAKLGNLKKLETFWFTTEDDLKTEQLPDDLGECGRLQKVRFSRARVKQLPPSFTQANNLSYLSMGSNGLTHLPHTMEQWTKLTELLLNYNPITVLPQGFSSLKCLTTLHLAGILFVPTKTRYHEQEYYESWFDNQGRDILKALPKSRVLELYELCKEETGEIQATNLHKINAHLFYEVPRLGLDYVSGDEDGGIPEAIFQLENLETLDLSNQAIRFVPPQIKKLQNLKKLTLGKNMLLQAVCGELGSMTKLTTIGLRNCPSLKTPPVEVIGRGVDAVKAFLRRLSGGTTENWRTKLMLVGLGGAGKTSLLRALTSPNHKTAGTSAEEITDGIDIKTWTVKSSDDKKITFSTWDFAGQDVYYNTHQFFLSGRAVYLLLWTCRLGYQHAGLDFWLSSIQCHAPMAPIFIVGTHCDQVTKAELPKDMLMKKYPQIKGFHLVSSIKGTGIAELEQHVKDTTQKESYMGESIPTVYLNLENKILQLRKQKKVVPWTKIEELATECGIFELKDIKRAVTFLHDLGTVQYFDNEFLRDHVVINPQWIVDVMACVVSIKDSPIQDGAFKHEDIKKVWEEYPEDLHEWLLRLTEEFDLTFPIPSQPINLVPCLLPQSEPKFEWPEVREGERETMMLYKFTYLPAGLFNRTQVRLFQFSDGKDIWKRGSLLRKNDHLALIKQLNDKEMLVRVQGPRPENVLFLIHEVIESLVVESFSGVHYDFLIPCPDCIKKTRTAIQETAAFEASLIKRAAEWNAPFLQCREHFHTLSMSVLQAHLPPDRSVEFDVHMSQSVRALQNLQGSCSTDVFILYCEADLTQDPSVHPRTVNEYLQKAGFTCHYKENLSKTGIEEVMLDLKDSKMVVVFMSDNFEKDKQCHEMFLYAKHALSKPFQVVACGSTLNWMDTKLGGMEIGKHHVYVKMTEKKRYDAKIKELEQQLTTKLQGLKQASDHPRCFLSYAWTNSHDAVLSGSKRIPAALGWEKGDPRILKRILEENGITCWLDIEQTGKTGLFEDISQGILHADMVIACVSDQYRDSKNCMMELRYAECTLDKPMLAVVVGTGNDWMRSEVQILLDRSKTPTVSLQSPNESGIDKIIKHSKNILAKCGEKTVSKKQQTAEPTMKINNISFHEEFELAQRKLLRHVSIVAATMESMPYPRFIVLDFKKKESDEEDTTQAQEQEQVERPTSAMSMAPGTRPPLQKRVSKVQQVRGGKDDYDPTWTEIPLVVRLLCEYDGGCHVAEEDVDFGLDLSASEKESLVRDWSQYLGPVYALLKHSTVTLNLMATEQGKHLQSFVNQNIQEAHLDFVQAYIRMRERVMLVDKDRRMGGLDRCYLPTGQIRWLCKEHQKGYRITVLSNDVDVGGRFGDNELVSEDDRLIAAHIDKMAYLAEPYLKGRSKKPRKMEHMTEELEGFSMDEGRFDENGRAKNLQKTNSSERKDLSEENLDSASLKDGSKSTPSTEGKPKPKSRQSLLGSKDRPVSARTQARMKGGAQTMGPGMDEKTSKACTIL